MGRLCALAMLAFSPTASAETVTWTWQGTDGSVIHGAEPLPNGNVLVSEKVLGRIIEVVPAFPAGGTIVWERDGLSTPDRTRRLANGNTLIAETGANRVLEVDPDGGVVWSYGDGTLRCVPESTDLPGDVERLPNGNTLVPGEWLHRIVEIEPTGAIAWRYGRADCTEGANANETANPFSVMRMANDEILVAEINNDRVVAISRTPPTGGTVTWAYGARGSRGSGPNQLAAPVRSLELESGNVLITDRDNHRVLEVTPTRPTGGTIVWQYGASGVSGTDAGYLAYPYDAHRVATGATLIAERDNRRVQLVVPASAPAQLRFETAPQTARVGECSTVVTVRLLGTSGLATPAPRATRVELTATAPLTTFYSDDSCLASITAVQVAAGGSAAQFYFRTISEGSPTLTTRAPWLIPAAQTEVVVARTPVRVLQVGCGCNASTAMSLIAALAFFRRRRCRWRQRSSVRRSSVR